MTGPPTGSVPARGLGRQARPRRGRAGVLAHGGRDPRADLEPKRPALERAAECRLPKYAGNERQNDDYYSYHYRPSIWQRRPNYFDRPARCPPRRGTTGRNDTT